MTYLFPALLAWASLMLMIVVGIEIYQRVR
jgi:hypothetical protein